MSGSFPGNLKPFGQYHQELGGKNCQEWQKFIKNHVYLVLMCLQR